MQLTAYRERMKVMIYRIYRLCNGEICHWNAKFCSLEIFRNAAASEIHETLLRHVNIYLSLTVVLNS